MWYNVSEGRCVMAYDKNSYNNQYKKDHFDHVTFYVPKGIKAKVVERANSLGISYAEYLRRLIEKDLGIEKDTQ